MANFNRISIEQAREILAQPQALLLDIRDAQSFAASHVAQALPVTSENLATIIEQTVPHVPLLVVCYHGISSQNVAQYLSCQGFTQVASVDGGMEAWQQQFPQDLTID